LVPITVQTDFDLLLQIKAEARLQAWYSQATEHVLLDRSCCKGGGSESKSQYSLLARCESVCEIDLAIETRLWPKTSEKLSMTLNSPNMISGVFAEAHSLLELQNSGILLAANSYDKDPNWFRYVPAIRQNFWETWCVLRCELGRWHLQKRASVTYPVGERVRHPVGNQTISAPRTNRRDLGIVSSFCSGCGPGGRGPWGCGGVWWAFLSGSCRRVWGFGSLS